MSGKETSIWSDPKVAERYKLVERITGPFARCLIRQAEMHQVEETPFVILDNACGTGVVSSQLYETLDKSVTDRMQLTCGDSSEGMIQYVQKMIEDKGWKGAKAQIVDAQKTGLPSEHFTHVITNFGVMGVPDPTAALNECFRMLKPGGICALSTWDTIGWIGDVRAAFATIPGAPPFPDVESWLASWGEGAWHRATYVEQQLTAHGFVNVRVEIVPDTVTIPSPEQYYEVFSPMVQHIKTKFWSEDECERCGGSIKPALLKYLTDKYGEGRPIETNWAAILTTASKPSK